MCTGTPEELLRMQDGTISSRICAELGIVKTGERSGGEARWTAAQQPQGKGQNERGEYYRLGSILRPLEDSSALRPSTVQNNMAVSENSPGSESSELNLSALQCE
jgi:hypothetical protein